MYLWSVNVIKNPFNSVALDVVIAKSSGYKFIMQNK